MLQPQPNFQIILVPANIFYYFLDFFIHLFLAVLGHLSSYGERRPLFVMDRAPVLGAWA